MNPISHARPSLLNPRFGHRFMCLALCVLVAGWAVADTGSVQLTDGVIPTVAKPVVHLLKLRTVDTEGGMIDPGLTAYVERVVEEADSAGIDALVFDTDTFGGRVDAATIIRDAILDADLLTIAFINNRAISAGALISLACDKIVMVKGGTIGASTPVSGGGEKAGDKYVSVMRAEMRATAERTDRDTEIAEAMVDERIYIPGFSDEVGQPATLTTEQALQYGIADETAGSLQQMLEIYDLGDAKVVEIEINWAERVVRLLTHPIVTSILLSVAIFGLIAEVRTPGWGLGGSLALMALALFFGSHLIVHLANWEELVLFGIGLVLLFVEIALIPGFGFAGVAGIVCMLASVLLTRLPEFTFWSVDQIGAVVGQFALSMIGAVAVSVFVLKSLPKVAAFNRLILSSDTKASDGYVSAPTTQDQELVGLTGVTVSELRPVGIGSFDGRRLDIIAEGEFIAQQTTVKIISAHGSRIVVRAI
ncbi:MAG TPA: NfeD family protein [Candidatus Latescibacteria bacterium]|nr:NfeD family protein [Candidatus Latescibacterota bacterium]